MGHRDQQAGRSARARGRGSRARRRARASGPAREAGFSLVEVIAAVSILAVALLGLASSMGMGLKSVALGRQRQTASEIANARIEHLRNVPYESLELDVAPVHDDDPEHPSHLVSADGSGYDPSGTGVYEPLIVSAGGDGVPHIEDPVQVGETVMEIYQYITWVDDPGIPGTEDLRRVAVVVKFKAPAVDGTTHTLGVSSLFTPGTVTLGGETDSSTTTTSGSTTTTVPSTTTTAPTTCAGDTSAPTGGFTISSGTGVGDVGYTASPNATLHLTFGDDCAPLSAVARFSNDGTTFGDDVVYDALNPTVSWTLSSGDGTKTVYGRVRDGSGNEADLTPQQIVLDTVAPTTPGTLARTVSCAGSNRTVTLYWGLSTDTNFRGYRLYRSTNNEAFEAVGTFTGTTTSETHAKKLDSVRYHVVGYDKAGNESDATNEIVLSKNQCS
ncbi:MAG: prepilin-type N-terminal cleavage/methylation domain-containing protein [Acidimicrobiia bacterium]|nr:prepilin-type N-terminal cleavage/methylation domain-containing protein [Acidimicrobiia bacterium]